MQMKSLFYHYLCRYVAYFYQYNAILLTDCGISALEVQLTLAINRNGNNQQVGEGCKINPFASSLARVCGTDMSLPKSRGEYYC